jgi:SAM-dependent methyltransferase
MDEAFWNQLYDSNTALWSGNPNPQLVAEATHIAPGTALEVGCGEGADAIWLAERGWDVTAVDLSTVALERGAARAREVSIEASERISWLQADLTSWVPPASTYDLVSSQFMGLRKDERDALQHRLAASVSPGGFLLVVGHHPLDLPTTTPGPPVHGPSERFFTASDVAASLDPQGWDITVCEARPRPTLDPQGRTITIHDAVLMAQRRSQ